MDELPNQVNRADNGAWSSLDLVFDQAEKQIEFQGALWDKVDQRLQLLLGFVGIIFAATAGLSRAGTFSPVAQRLGVVSVILLLVSAVVTGVAYWPRTFNRPPDIASFRLDALGRAERETKLELVDNLILAYNHNGTILRRKIRLFRLAFVAIGGAILLAGLALLAQLTGF